jgi:L-serine dehydratase
MVSLLDIIGPVMVGPSSSHTAGACRIGLFARALAGGQPEKARVELHGSFAGPTGHGTDARHRGRAARFGPDDERLRESLGWRRAGLTVEFHNAKLRGDHHPNTARITVTRGADHAVVTGSSLGAGRIVITEIDGFPVDVTGALPSLVFVAKDQPGIVATVTSTLAGQGGNIATMKVSRRRKGGEAIHIYELDEPASEGALAAIRALPQVRALRAVPRIL